MDWYTQQDQDHNETPDPEEIAKVRKVIDRCVEDSKYLPVNQGMEDPEEGGETFKKT